ncbi:putative CPA1 family transporter [Gordonia hirsuta DSM 44140 = NBRC 16056]|uniref:Putative CPA1 family transporter n=1 Tax=Gordonia hirsuta DSM 44140 = NBRC 16056 TaxID=1121927 RepID=L7LFN7_9ACTN|nr:cation:proton antiporter [Gordonia hirsuta]GAC58878.1 putative CPA1 family transporter [Gordonia hirsuta DSM 44140 = NBRC 16056]
MLFAAGLSILAWALFARRFGEWRVAPALVLAGAGVITSVSLGMDLAEPLYSPVTERVVEMILALLLFVDATEVRGGLLGRDRGGALRLVLIALPVSLLGAMILGWLVLPTSMFAVCLMIACAVMPTDLSPHGTLFGNSLVPERVRHLLNVESGYNDGVVAPLFVFGLTLVEGHGAEDGFVHEALAAVESAGISLLVGAGAGLLVGFLANAALRTGLTSDRALGITVLMTALLTYGLATIAGGNGFVAAFICGIVYRLTRDHRIHGSELEFVQDVAIISNLLVWFAFGLVLDYVFDPGVLWSTTALVAVCAVTVLRFVPVQLSLLGSGYGRRDRNLIACLGPRGTASIVFGLLAWTKVAGDDVDDASLILVVVAWTVALSLIVYSVAAVLLAARQKEPA